MPQNTPPNLCVIINRPSAVIGVSVSCTFQDIFNLTPKEKKTAQSIQIPCYKNCEAIDQDTGLLVSYHTFMLYKSI